MVNVCARQLWRNDDLHRMRQNVRQAERKWCHTWLVVHRQITRTCLTHSNNASLRPNQITIVPRLKSLPEIPKIRYHITNDLMGRTRQTVLPKCDGDPAELAELFVTFFIAKIVDICSRLAMLRNLNQPFVFEPSDCHIEDHLFNFTVATSDDVCCLVMKSTSTFSPDMDVVPTYLAYSHLCSHALWICHSNHQHTVPKVMKNAVVTPWLKKSGLDPDSLSNYRPISNLSFISKLMAS